MPFLVAPKSTRTWANPQLGWFQSSLGFVNSKALLLRVLALALIATSYSANATWLPLFITHLPNGSTTDVGVYAGLVAGWETPFMLIGGYLSRNLALWRVIIAVGLVYVVYLVGLRFATSLWQIYALTILNAAGAANLLSQHISYLQDLMPDRPGLGSLVFQVPQGLVQAWHSLAAECCFGWTALKPEIKTGPFRICGVVKS